MRFWSREILGWLLVVLGVGAFALAVRMLTIRQIVADGEQHTISQVVEAGQIIIIGVVLFRGGIHLLKVAVAARVCLLAQQREDRG